VKPRYKHLCEHSLNMALSAIEIYNKPNFAAREQIFSILMVNAWESLFKAKLVKDAGNRLNVLYVKEGRQYKRTRSGHHFTIDMGKAMELCPVPEIARENIRHLLDVRNAATHLAAPSESLPLLVFTLGSATLSNYARLVRDWFGVGLNDYNFYILPLGFSYPFRTISTVDLRKEPEDIARIVSAVASSQDQESEDEGFFLVCELQTTLVSAKKISDITDITARVDPMATETVVLSPMRPIDRYPLLYLDVWKRVKAQLPNVKQHQLNTFIREQRIKGNPNYAMYHYRHKAEEKRGPQPTTAILYNEDCVRFCVDSLRS
jgi:hypothetical protein